MHNDFERGARSDCQTPSEQFGSFLKWSIKCSGLTLNFTWWSLFKYDRNKMHFWTERKNFSTLSHGYNKQINSNRFRKLGSFSSYLAAYSLPSSAIGSHKIKKWTRLQSYLIGPFAFQQWGLMHKCMTQV